MPVPRVAIIIINWNGQSDTLACLASLREDIYANKQIIVVDNGSRDDSVSVIRAAYPDVTVLSTGTNLGFTGGNNVGIRHALQSGADYVYLLNNDTAVEPDALTILVAAAEAESGYGLLTPVIHYFDQPDEPWFAGSQLDLSRGIAIHDNQNAPAQTDAPREIPWASGCAMLIRAELARQLDGFDDRYFLNWEDVDLSLRLRNLGFKIALVPAARIYHKVGRSFETSGTGRYYHVRNHLLFISIHSGRAAHRAALYVISTRLRESLRAIKNRRAGPADSLPTTLRAIRDHMQGRYSVAHL